jgi:hypothetical protein
MNRWRAVAGRLGLVVQLENEMLQEGAYGRSEGRRHCRDAEIDRHDPYVRAVEDQVIDGGQVPVDSTTSICPASMTPLPNPSSKEATGSLTSARVMAIVTLASFNDAAVLPVDQDAHGQEGVDLFGFHVHAFHVHARARWRCAAGGSSRGV